jgi:FeS assembly protein IscX
LTNQVLELYWDSTYAIATVLMDDFPQYKPEDIGLYELAALVEALPGFQDDPSLVTEQILLDIQTVWYEETTTL